MLLEPQMYDIKDKSNVGLTKTLLQCKRQEISQHINNGIDQDTTQLKNV
jgi:hypothetical protein